MQYALLAPHLTKGKIDIPTKYLTIAIISSVFLLSCGDSPTAPGDDLVGTWVMVKSADRNLVEAVMVFRADGTFRVSMEVEGFGSMEETGLWEIVADKIALTFNGFLAGNRNMSQGYTLRGDRLTFLYEDGSVEVWERRE